MSPTAALTTTATTTTSPSSSFSTRLLCCSPRSATARSRLQPQPHSNTHQAASASTRQPSTSSHIHIPAAASPTLPTHHYHHTYATLPARLPSVSEVQAAQSFSRSSSCRLPSRATSLRRQKSSARRSRTGIVAGARDTRGSLVSASAAGSRSQIGLGLSVEETIGLAIALAELEEV